MQIRYFANLGEDNAKDIIESAGAREAVLCSCGKIPGIVKTAARKVNAEGILLAADNGNTSIIFQLVREFSDRASELKNLQKAENGTLTGKELVGEYQELLEEIIARAGAFTSLERQKAVLLEQMDLQPQFFICLEDLTVPVIVNLDLEPAIAGKYKTKLVKLQDHGIEAAKAVLSGKLQPIEGRPYAAVHAVDYDSAFKVGKKAGGVKTLEGIATGFASFLNDRNYINSYTLKGKRIWITNKKSIPQRYVRTLLVALGLIDGFSSARNGCVPYFHGLGAGSPIVLALLSLCAYGSRLFSVDSTSPDKNASMGKIFTSKPAPLTLSVEGIAQALVEERQVWDCKCPACKEIANVMPFDISSAQIYYRNNIAPRKIGLDDLKREDGIGKFLSFCSEARTNSAVIDRARTEHSHWALIEILDELRSHSQSYGSLRQKVGRICEAYKATTTSTYSIQIDECLKLIDRLR